VGLSHRKTFVPQFHPLQQYHIHQLFETWECCLMMPWLLWLLHLFEWMIGLLIH
jgi:hypothetical protein